MVDNFFEERKNIKQVEESNELAPKFNNDGLIPVVTTDFKSGEVLMQGYMNEEAFTQTISRGYTITTISPSSLDFEERMKRIPEEPLLTARIERDNLISEIRSFGLHIGDWRDGESVNTVLQGG